MKYLMCMLAAVVLVLPSATYAQPTVPQTSPSDIVLDTGGGESAGLVPCTDDCTLEHLIQMGAGIFDFLITLAGVLAIGALVVAGILYMTAGGEERKVATAKQTATWGIVGLLLALFSYVIIHFVLNTLGLKGEFREGTGISNIEHMWYAVGGFIGMTKHHIQVCTRIYNKRQLLFLFVVGLVTSMVVAMPAHAIDNPIGACDTLGGCIAILINAVITLSGIIAIGFFIYGGFIYITSGGDEKSITRGKQAMVGAVIGLIAVIAAYVVVNFVLTSLGAGDSGGGGEIGN